MLGLPIFNSIGFHSTKYRRNHYFKSMQFTYQTELNKLSIFQSSIFQEEENSFFLGFCANVAKQVIVYCEFNCQTGEVKH